MFNLKYDNRHTFFISASVILFLFGLYPFYVLNIKEIPVKILIFHIPTIIVGIWLFVKGINLWGDRDEENKEIIKFLKEDMKRNNELVKINIEQNKINLNKLKLSSELGTLTEDLKKKKEDAKKVKDEIEAKRKENKKVEEELVKKQDELWKQKEELLNQRNKSIEQLPDTMFTSGSSTAYPWTSTTAYPSSPVLFTSTSPTVAVTPTEYHYICSSCGRTFKTNELVISSLCPECSKSFTYQP